MSADSTGDVRVLIVDDEPLAARRLQIQLARVPGVKVVGETTDPEEALRLISEIAPDIVMLDIQMPGRNAFEVIEAMPETCAPLVIFVTAFERYALQAFRAEAVDYLLKPVEADELGAAIERARRILSDREAAGDARSLRAVVEQLREDIVALDGPRKEDFWIKTIGRSHRLPVQSIDWIEAVRDYACLHSEGRTFLIRETMSALEMRLDRRRFLRVHRSAIVNLDRIAHLRHTETGAQTIVLKSGTEIRIGRTFQRRVNRHLKSAGLASKADTI